MSTLKLVGMGVTETLRFAEPVIDPKLAEITVCPVAALVAKPDASIIATAGDVELQSTLVLTSFIKPLAKVPTALNCWVAPGVIVVIGGTILIETNGSCTVSDAEPVSDP